MARIDPHQRPLYPPAERMAILEHKAARGWSLDIVAALRPAAALAVRLELQVTCLYGRSHLPLVTLVPAT